MSDQIKKLLNDLANFEAQKEVMRFEKEELINGVIPADLRKAISDIAEEFADKTIAVDENIDRLREEIKQLVISDQKSIKGTFLQAVYNNGKITWDNKELEKHMQAHPEIVSYRKVGKPFVSIRNI